MSVANADTRWSPRSAAWRRVESGWTSRIRPLCARSPVQLPHQFVVGHQGVGDRPLARHPHQAVEERPSAAEPGVHRALERRRRRDGRSRTAGCRCRVDRSGRRAWRRVPGIEAAWRRVQVERLANDTRGASAARPRRRRPRSGRLRSLYATQKTPSACQRSYHIRITVRSCPEKRRDGLSSRVECHVGVHGPVPLRRSALLDRGGGRDAHRVGGVGFTRAGSGARRRYRRGCRPRDRPPAPAGPPRSPPTAPGAPCRPRARTGSSARGARFCAAATDPGMSENREPAGAPRVWRLSRWTCGKMERPFGSVDLAVGVGRRVDHAEHALGIPAAPPEPVHAAVGSGEPGVRPPVAAARATWVCTSPASGVAALLQRLPGGHAERVRPAARAGGCGSPARYRPRISPARQATRSACALTARDPEPPQLGLRHPARSGTRAVAGRSRPAPPAPARRPPVGSRSLCRSRHPTGSSPAGIFLITLRVSVSTTVTSLDGPLARVELAAVAGEADAPRAYPDLHRSDDRVGGDVHYRDRPAAAVGHVEPLLVGRQLHSHRLRALRHLDAS